jgi:leader peptidase (prepilin peptidase) / N-methyltransferase
MRFHASASACIRLTDGALMIPAIHHWFWSVAAFLLGASFGSFLNVVIYRLPLGLSVNEPKRSFCPSCKKEIPFYRNLPLISWLALRGKCADCKASISVRYFVVELLTALVFVAFWRWLAADLGTTYASWIQVAAVVPLWVMAATFIAIAFIDAEHYIIPLVLTWLASVAGLGAAWLYPRLTDLAGWTSHSLKPLDGLMQSGLGWAAGFFGLWSVVLLGKLAFGRRKMAYEVAQEWMLVEPEKDDEPIHFVIGEERIPWWDLFHRKSDRLLVESDSIEVDGRAVASGLVTITEGEVVLPGGEKLSIEQLKSLSGTALKVTIPREAMGMGDVHLLGTIGAFFGWSGVLFSLFSASFYALIAALIGRIGFGRQLPFGPFLILGAVTWMFAGWKLAEWYFQGLAAGF